MTELLKYICMGLKKSEKGVSLIEFALVLPILLALLIGIVEFGWILNGHITVTGAAREGARVAVVGAEKEEIDAAVNRHIDPLNIIGLDIDDGVGDFGNQTYVTVSGGLNSLTGFIGGDGSIIPLPSIYPVNISSTAIMRQEQYSNNE